MTSPHLRLSQLKLVIRGCSMLVFLTMELIRVDAQSNCNGNNTPTVGAHGRLDAWAQDSLVTENMIERGGS